jgi:hypothetical protein
MITSCAEKISMAEFIGTALGIPVVPEVYNRVVSSKTPRVTVGAAPPATGRSSKRMEPGTSSPSPTPTSNSGVCSASAIASPTMAPRPAS